MSLNRDLDRARKSHRRMFRVIIGFWVGVLLLISWVAYELVSAGPEGIGNAIGRFIKSVEDGAA